VNSHSGVIADLKLKHADELEKKQTKLIRVRTQRNTAAILLGAAIFALIILVIAVCISSNRSATRLARVHTLEDKVTNLTAILEQTQALLHNFQIQTNGTSPTTDIHTNQTSGV